MAMLEEHRNTIYQYFLSRLGKEATQALLSQYPSRDVDEPATKAEILLMNAEIQLVRAEMTALEARLRAEIKDLENRLTTRMVALAGVGLAAMTLLFNVCS